MAVNEYDDPRNNPNLPVFRSTTIGEMPSQGTIYSDLHDPALGGTGGGGGNIFSWLYHQLKKPFTNDTPRQVTPPTQPSTPSTPKAGPTTTQTLVNSIPDILAALATLKAMQTQNGGANGANPAGDALTGLVPQLSTQLNALLQNDVQRRQLSDPLYQAVLNGAMGGLPVWMRGGLGGAGNSGGTVVPPRTAGSGVPVTPGTDLFRPQGGDPEGYAFPNRV